MTALMARLEAGLDALSLTLDEPTRKTLVSYVELLHKWNRAYNLTAVRDPLAMMTRHVIDSLTILPWVTGPTLLDVGSGPGLPGMVMAIVRPDLNVTLLDSNGKKVRFQRQAAMELDLGNVTPWHTRIESLDGSLQFDQITSRAFSSLHDFVTLSERALAPRGEWLAMKGRLEEETVEALPNGCRQIDCHALHVPGDEGERHLIRLARV